VVAAAAIAAATLTTVALVLLLVVGFLGYLTLDSTDHTTDVEAASTDLAHLPGVVSVTHDYEPSEGILDGPGTAYAQVDMSRDATLEETLEVVAFAYSTFPHAVGGDYCNVVVNRGRAHLVVHTQSPDAPLEQVLQVAVFALQTPRGQEGTTTDITALDQPDMDDLNAEVRLGLGPGSTVDDIEPRLAELTAAGDVPDTDVWVVAADGSALGGSRGLPTTEDVAVWHALREVPSPASGTRMRVEYGPYSLYDDVRHTEFAVVKLHGRPAPSRDELRGLRSAQTAILAEHGDSYVYTVFVNGNSNIWLQRRGHI